MEVQRGRELIFVAQGAALVALQRRRERGRQHVQAARAQGPARAARLLRQATDRARRVRIDDTAGTQAADASVVHDHDRALAPGEATLDAPPVAQLDVAVGEDQDEWPVDQWKRERERRANARRLRLPHGPHRDGSRRVGEGAQDVVLPMPGHDDAAPHAERGEQLEVMGQKRASADREENLRVALADPSHPLAAAGGEDHPVHIAARITSIGVGSARTAPL